MITAPNTRISRLASRRGLFLLAALLQLSCLIVFLYDVLSEWGPINADTAREWFGIIALSVGAAITFREYGRIVKRNTKVERQLDVASGDFQRAVTHHFDQWALTAAERDVALLVIKGLPNAEIARLRGSREGTVKAQTAVIYRKAGVASRAELVSLLIEDLIAGL